MKPAYWIAALVCVLALGVFLLVKDPERARTALEAPAGVVREESPKPTEKPALEIPAPQTPAAAATESAADVGARTSEPRVPETAVDWERQFAGQSLGQVVDAVATLETQYSDLTMPELQRQFDAGQYTVLARDGVFHGQPSDDTEIFMVQMPVREPGGDCEVRKSVLPPEKFPELYEMHRKLNWLRQRQNELESRPRK